MDNAYQADAVGLLASLRRGHRPYPELAGTGAAGAVPAWKFRDPATGLPPSISLMCAPGSEDRLFAAARRVEGAPPSSRWTATRCGMSAC